MTQHKLHPWPSWVCASLDPTYTSHDLQELQLAVHHLHVAEAAALDVPDVGEVARARRALVVDLFAFGEGLQALDRAVDLLAGALADLAYVVLERCPSRLLRLGDSQNDEARPVVRLRLVGIGLCHAEALGRQRERLAVDVGRGLTGEELG